MAGNQFPSTRNSLVEALHGADPELRRRAFDTLVRSYWKPVYKYVRLRWNTAPEDAEDLTQEFFALAYEKGHLDRYDPAKARFRTFLRVCVDGAVANARKAGARLKRGGGITFVSMDFPAAERETLAMAAGPDDEPDQLFRREWIRSLFELALSRLDDECRDRGKDAAFGLFKAYDVERGPEPPTYGALAERFGIPETQVTNLLAHARRRFRHHVLEVLRDLTASDDEFAEEAREILGRRRMSHPVSDAALQHLQAMVDWPAIAAERYELRELLGRGGMGSVYLTHDRELDRLVAIKVLSTHLPSVAAMERLVREARILARLEHPGIVPVHDTGVTEDGRPYYVMKLVKGTGLAGRVATGLPPGDGFRIFERICDAVALAHSLGVVHRDLKPGNIMVGSFGEVLVMDWGVAKLADARELPGTVLGTPGYMSPEQARGDVAATDHRTDIYALGVMLESLLPDSPAPALRAIARKAAAPEPADRYQSVPALADDLSRFRAGLAVVAYPENLFRRLRRVAWKYRVPIALILAYVLMRVALLLTQD